jgi:predicted ATP-dependent endonuclease of OLD family
MKISKVEIKNFRLLQDVELHLENGTTLVVGRNNSGKTSLAELFRRLLLENSANFRLEDFSLGVHADFWTAFGLAAAGKMEPEIRAALPVIGIALRVTYSKDAPDLGLLGDFVVDLDPDCTEVRIEIIYQLEDGKLKALLSEIESDPEAIEEERQWVFFDAMKERVPKYYKCGLVAVDPNDPTNRKPLEWSKLRALIQGDLITAHRGLDDTTHKDNDSLGKILSALFATAGSESAADNDRKTAAELKAAVKEVQSDIDKTFNGQLANLLPAFNLFGYRLPDPKLRTETLLDVELLLKNHTKIRYSGINGIHLPEAYNGLGARNLIYILLKLFEAFKSFRAKQAAPAVHVVFIEEPEAHLHPQMQEVFIQKLGEIAQVFATISGGGQPWPVQFVVSTHSSHMANKAPFDAVRYFLSAAPAGTKFFSSKVKDLKRDFGDQKDADNKFLHQYMSQTRCDLLFANKVILIEGTTERLLLPKLAEKTDAALSAISQLGSQYIAVLEVGGAYAHIFFKLLDFLELHSLIITDLDAVNAATGGTACKVSDGTGTSNACIRTWFGDPAIAPAALLAKKPEEKLSGIRRIAYQVPERDGAACGRSFEDAFMLANATKFALDAADAEQSAWDQASKVKKSEFALKYAIVESDWNVPRYVQEALTWLAEVGIQTELQAKPTEAVIEVSIPKEAPLGK